MKSYLWDYDEEELKKTEQGRILLLERAINYGPEKNEKLDSSLIRKYWSRLNLFPDNKRLMELLIWEKARFLPKTKK